MRAAFVAIALVCSASAFAESQPKEAKKIASENPTYEEKLEAQAKKFDEAEGAFFRADVSDPDIVDEPQPITEPKPVEEPIQEEVQEIEVVAKKKNTEGLALFKKKKFDKANDAFYSATLLDPDNASYHKNYGRSLLGSGDAFSAAYEFEFSLELREDLSVLVELAKAYEKSGQINKALDTYLQASQQGNKAATKNYLRLKNQPPKVESISRPPSKLLTCFGVAEESDRELPESIKNITIQSLFTDPTQEPEQDPVLKLIFQ